MGGSGRARSRTSWRACSSVAPGRGGSGTIGSDTRITSLPPVVTHHSRGRGPSAAPLDRHQGADRAGVEAKRGAPDRHTSVPEDRSRAAACITCGFSQAPDDRAGLNRWHVQGGALGGCQIGHHMQVGAGVHHHRPGVCLRWSQVPDQDGSGEGVRRDAKPHPGRAAFGGRRGSGDGVGRRGRRGGRAVTPNGRRRGRGHCRRRCWRVRPAPTTSAAAWTRVRSSSTSSSF